VVRGRPGGEFRTGHPYCAASLPDRDRRRTGGAAMLHRTPGPRALATGPTGSLGLDTGTAPVEPNAQERGGIRRIQWPRPLPRPFGSGPEVESWPYRRRGSRTERADAPRPVTPGAAWNATWPSRTTERPTARADAGGSSTATTSGIRLARMSCSATATPAASAGPDGAPGSSRSTTSSRSRSGVPRSSIRTSRPYAGRATG
jgi:hypothetical protein